MTEYRRSRNRQYAIAAGLLVCGLLLPSLTIYLHYEWELSQHKQDPVRLLEIATKVGANAMVRELTENEYVWTNVLDGIKSGDSNWLLLANEISTSGSAHSGEELYGALSVVLDRTPEKILSLPKVDPEIVCGFVDDHGGTDISDLGEVYRHRVQIVGAINNTALVARKAICLESAKYLLRR